MPFYNKEGKYVDFSKSTTISNQLSPDLLPETYCVVCTKNEVSKAAFKIIQLYLEINDIAFWCVANSFQQGHRFVFLTKNILWIKIKQLQDRSFNPISTPLKKMSSRWDLSNFSKANSKPDSTN